MMRGRLRGDGRSAALPVNKVSRCKSRFSGATNGKPAEERGGEIQRSMKSIIQSIWAVSM